MKNQSTQIPVIPQELVDSLLRDGIKSIETMASDNANLFIGVLCRKGHIFSLRSVGVDI